MRLLPLCLLALALAACGSNTEPTGAPASSTPSESSAEGSGTADPSDTDAGPVDESNLKPPAVLLVYKGQKQKGVLGGYCVDYVDADTGQGEGLCTDGPAPYPKAITAVAPGDRVTFVLEKATFKAKSVVKISPLGCTENVVGQVVLEPGTGEQEWKVNLGPGAYQLDLFARFKADDGRRGDLGAALGLTVAGAKENDALGVRDVKRADQVCPYPD